MHRIRRLVSLPLLAFSFVLNAQNGPIPAGEIRGPFEWKSKIYPGTERNYWVYVPKQYDPAKAACSMILQDGLDRAKGWRLPTILDSLIYTGDLPVVIGIFIDHGKVPASSTDPYPRFNRSFEYDALGDRYARFLLEEIIPEVSKTYSLSTKPGDRSIAGASSGAICAFNVAWERPDQFQRVLSTIGTYVGLRGGDEFATLVRKTEPKPLRIFLEDGDHDLNIYAGDWWMANQNMLSALTWAGYEVNHAWGKEGHNSKGAVVILAEALKWLWKDYPNPVETHQNPAAKISPVMVINPVLDGEPWNEITLKDPAEKLAVNKMGELFFTSGKSIYRVRQDGVVSVFATLKEKVGGITFSSDGLLYASLPSHKVISINEPGVVKQVATGITAEFLAASQKGIYFTDRENKRVGFYSFTSRKVVYNDVPHMPGGLTLTPEQTFLQVAFADGVFGYSYRINESGTPDNGQDYIHYHVPYGEAATGAGGMTADANGLVYTATVMGIQVTDQLGRVNFIFANPGKAETDVKFGGRDFNTLYLSAGGKLFKRKVNAKGILSWLPPVKPPKSGL